MNRVRELFPAPAYNQLIELPEKRCKRFSGTGGSENQRMRATRDRRPSRLLRGAWLAGRLPEPPLDERMKPCCHAFSSRHIMGQRSPGLENTPKLLRSPFE